jgi:hypothetical protein
MRWRPFKTIDAINKLREFKSEVEYQDAHVVLRSSETHEAMALFVVTNTATTSQRVYCVESFTKARLQVQFKLWRLDTCLSNL